VTLEEQAKTRLAELDARGLRRHLRPLEAAHGPSVEAAGQSVVLLSSNDYLGLAGHEQLRASLARASRQRATGAAASRLISGTQRVHRDAEARLAELTRSARALLFSSGYAANVGVLSSLPRAEDVIFSDALNHASIIDGCRLSKARVIVFPHADVHALTCSLERHRSHHRAAFIVTDALSPLSALSRLSTRFDASLIVDEAHSLGVLGPAGAGACAEAGITPDLLVGTLGKALGLWGAFAASSPSVIQLLENSARSFVFSTATSPAGAAACIVACDLVQAADHARARLLRHANRLRDGLRSRGWRVPTGDAHIVPVVIGPAGPTMQISTALLERGFFVQGIRPPTVPEGTSRLRLAPMATHSDSMIEGVLAAFRDLERLRPD